MKGLLGKIFRGHKKEHPEKDKDMQIIEEKLNPSMYLNKKLDYIPQGTIASRSIENDINRKKSFVTYTFLVKQIYYALIRNHKKLYETIFMLEFYRMLHIY